MKYAVDLLIDEPDALKLKSAFASAGCPNAYTDTPLHICLATFEKADRPRLIEAVRLFAGRTVPFTIAFSSLGIFPGARNVVFLAPIVTRGLLDIHEDFHKVIQSFKIQSESYYLPGSWVPHCTITREETIETSISSIARIQSQPIFTQCRLSRVQIFKLSPATAKIGDFALSSGKGA